MENLIMLILKVVMTVAAVAVAFGLVDNMWVFITHGGLNGSPLPAIISFCGMIFVIVLIFLGVWKFIWSKA